ncbi:MAG TPA: hypothetical protein PKD37_01465 [Oligoflexia bacterium]|nr:hypothetical protein [Oligoflexia bacterium]HMP26644.1 hypothetical protein [Oligoflexia bacterium]
MALNRDFLKMADDFMQLPLLSLLPSLVSLNFLENFSSSLFLRYEAVLKASAQNFWQTSSELLSLKRRLELEANMLKLTLERLKISLPDKIEQKISEQEFKEISRARYSEDEQRSLYELGRFFLECGELEKAEQIFGGLNEVAPTFLFAWLGSAYVWYHAKNWDQGIFASRQALRILPESSEAILYLVVGLFNVGDFNSAGSYLGEINEQIDRGVKLSPPVSRFFKLSLARFQARI